MADLPMGTLTFVFTDIEGSTRLWEAQPEAMGAALAAHDTLLHRVVAEHGGIVFKTVGDAFCAAFAVAAQAVQASLAAQLALQSVVAETVPNGPVLHVRMAIHAGAAEARDGDYFGPTLNRVARLLSVAHGGQVLLSEATRQLVWDDLPPNVTLKDLGAHRLRDLQRSEQIYQLGHPELPAEFPPLRSLDSLPNNLPQQVTTFVGREREIAAVKEGLGRTRLLTLTGPGGTGKTRLSLQVAADVLGDYPDGVWFVELASLADAALVAQAVALALGVREERHRAITDTLLDHLRERRSLVVLDNCEHLLDACARLVEAVLRTCPGVTVLASSREALNIPGETTYPVPTLALPDPQRLPPVEALSQYEAVRLFIDRATTVSPAFSVTNANAPAVAQICTRLDGIPLAIELAAARIRSLPAEEINARLDQRFRLLTGGSRTALPRQQTLRALVDWSYDLLSDAERTLLRRLAVFTGGWYLPAVEAICAGDLIEEWEVLDLLSALVDKSLVLYDGDGPEPRYRMLETVRQYTHERLAESNEGTEYRRRHRDYHVERAARLNEDLRGPNSTPVADHIERDHDNYRAALRTALSEPEGAAAALFLAASLQPFWSRRGYYRELEECMGAALRASEHLGPSNRRLWALMGAAHGCTMRGRYEQAAAYFEEALAFGRESPEPVVLASVLLNYGGALTAMGELEAARAHLEEFLALLETMEPDPVGRAHGCSALATALSLSGCHTEAEPLLREALAVFQREDYPETIPRVLSLLGRGAQARGDFRAARDYYAQALELCATTRYRNSFFEGPYCFADLARAQGDGERAARLYGAHDGERNRVGSLLPPALRTEYEAALGELRAMLGSEAFEAAYAEGYATSAEHFVPFALAADR